MNSKSGLWAALLLLVPLWQVGALGTTILSIGDGDTIRVLQAGKGVTVRLDCYVLTAWITSANHSTQSDRIKSFSL